MSVGDGSSKSSGTSGTSVRKREYTAESASRHRSTGSTRRRLFFGLAALWGFLVGVAGLLISMGLTGQPANPGETVMPGLMIAFVIAIAGGYVMAAAYAETKRRARR